MTTISLNSEVATYLRGETECAVHAYVLITNRVHLLLTSANAGGVGAMMKRLGQRYVQYINRTYRRSGTLWEGRFRSCLTREESYVLGCYRYIELNPVSAGLVRIPGTMRGLVVGQMLTERGGWLEPHRCDRALASDNQGRQTAYRALLRYHLDPALVDQIRAATNSNYALGSGRFEEEVAEALGRRVVRGRSGRPERRLGRCYG